MKIVVNKSGEEGQLSLFDHSPLKVTVFGFQGTTAKIEWSYSRRQLMNQCLLAYYYRYYGASRRTAQNEPLKEELRFLKALSNRHMRTGKILHLVIKTYLKHRRDGNQLSAQWGLNWARKLYNEDLAFSRSYRRGVDSLPDGQNSPVLLAEFYYDSERAEAEWKESEERLSTALTNFFNNPDLQDFIVGGSRADAKIEESFPLKSNDFNLDANPDIVFLTDIQRTVIADWKIGEAGGSEDSLQLFAYALAVSGETGCSPQEIDLYLIHLSDGAIIPYTVDERQLMRTRVRIIQDVQRMRMMDEFGRSGDSAAFTPCQQRRICANCVFREVCTFALSAR